MATDPWRGISLPCGSAVSARRVDSDHPFEFFWARSHEGRCLLVFEYSNDIEVRDKRPKLGEVRIIEPKIDEEPSRFVLELTRDENREIFLRLCMDIVESTRECRDERSALATMIRRAWRWHGMLRGAREEKLSPEKQKGLIGELRVLEIALLRCFEPDRALDFWCGPERAPKDFTIGSVAIEAKAKSSVTRPYVRISSEDQLDADSLSALFLAVTYVDEADESHRDALSLNEYVDDIVSKIDTANPGALGLLDSRLDQADYSEDHDYSDHRWLIGKTVWFEVGRDFPRLTRAQLSGGIDKVEYNLDIASCSDWKSSLSEVNKKLLEMKL